MILIFVDESEWPRPKDPSGYTVWAAVALHASRSKQFFREVFNLVRKFWKVTEPYQFEIKGRRLVNRRGVTSPKRREFTEELLSLCKQDGLLAFAVGLPPSPPSFAVMPDPDIYRVYSLLIERIETMMSESFPDTMAVFAFDSQDEATDTKRALAFGNYLYGTPEGRSAHHIIETPFFVSSKATLGIQIADLFAYVLAQQNLGRTDLERFGDRIREMEWRSQRTDIEYPMHGFRFLPK